MKLSLLVFVLGLAGCLATEEPIEHDFSEDLAETDDEGLTNEEMLAKRSNAPSFDDVKRELEDQGILKNPFVIGLYPRGEEPIEEDKRAYNRSIKPAPSYRPLCPEHHLPPRRFHIGHTGTLLIRNFACRPYRCAKCGHKYGLCRMKYTYITLRVLYYNPLVKLGWTWHWRSYAIPGCCVCYA